LEIDSELESLMPISEDDYNRMRSDIEDRGVIIPVIATPDFMLVCGYNRLKIAKEIGLKSIPVIFMDIEDKEKETFAIKDNLNRRQLSTEQRAVIIAKLTEHIKKGRKPKKDKSPSTEEIAKDLGLSSATIRRAKQFVKQVKEKPELQGKSVRAVLTGEPDDRLTLKYSYTYGTDDENIEKDLMDAAGEILDMELDDGDQITVVVQAWVKSRK